MRRGTGQRDDGKGVMTAGKRDKEEKFSIIAFERRFNATLGDARTKHVNKAFICASSKRFFIYFQCIRFNIFIQILYKFFFDSGTLKNSYIIRKSYVIKLYTNYYTFEYPEVCF